jgi:hypothetical protein
MPWMLGPGMLADARQQTVADRSFAADRHRPGFIVAADPALKLLVVAVLLRRCRWRGGLALKVAPVGIRRRDRRGMSDRRTFTVGRRPR